MPKSSLSPRKEAQQKRSRIKVEKILQATLDMLADSSADLLTTNRIAERAGISIGTLYQFFPNKQAILYELYRQWLAETLEALDQVAEQVPKEASKREHVDAFLTNLIDPKLNSRARWKLRWAMSSSEKLIALENEHRREVLMRVHALQEKFGQRPPKHLESEVMMMQNEITLACLFSLSTLEGSPNRKKHIDLCRKLMLVIYDYPVWDQIEPGALD